MPIWPRNDVLANELLRKDFELGIKQLMQIVQIYRRKAAPCARGFTIMEAVIAMGVVGIVIISLYAALTSGFGGVQMGRENMRASEILVAKMDQFRLFSWDQITNATCIPTNFIAPFNPEGSTPTNTALPLVYRGTVTLSAFPDATAAYSNDMRQVTISLNWTSSSGLARSRSLTTFVGHYGLQNYIY